MRTLIDELLESSNSSPQCSASPGGTSAMNCPHRRYYRDLIR